MFSKKLFKGLSIILCFLTITSCSENRGVGFFMYTSTDQGSSWERKFLKIANTTTDTVVDPGLIKLSNGDILLYYLASNGHGDPASEQPDNKWRIGVARSTDNGESFSQEAIVFTANSTLSDPEPLELTDGSFVIYNLDITNNAIVSFSSTGTDPTQFNSSLDSGQRISAAGTPGALKIGSNYYVFGCNSDGIVYYSSSDGQSFTYSGIALSGTDGYIACDASISQMQNGTYIMAYKLSPNGSDTPETDVVLWASSSDGLTYTPGGLIGYGSVPGLIIDSNGTWRVYVPNYDVE